MTVREWLNSLNNDQLSLILTELKNGKYDNGNLDFNFTVRFHKLMPCLNEHNNVFEWLNSDMLE